MIGVGKSFAGSAAGVVRFPVPATLAQRREPIAVEPVRQVEPVAARHSAGPPGRASTPFVAQYIAQRLAPGSGGGDWGEASVAYRATVDRGITYLGFEAPLDVSV